MTLTFKSILCVDGYQFLGTGTDSEQCVRAQK